MKKLLAILLAFVMVFALSACGEQKPAGTTSGANADTSSAANTPSVDVKFTNDGNWIFASGGTSGTYYPLAGAISNEVNKQIKSNITVQSTGASKENVMLLSKDEAEFAIIQNDVLDYAFNGTGLFKESGKISGFTTVASIYAEVCQIVVASDSGINSVADLKGKRVSIGDAGSGVEANALQILEAHGLTVDDIKVSRLSFKESGNAFKDGQIDAFFVTSGVPNTAITELAVTRSLKLLDIVGDAATKLMADYPFYTVVTIPKDVYKTESDITTLGVRALIVCRDDLTEEEVYHFTKAVYENLDSLGNAHAKAKEFKLEDAKAGVTVPLHPGAEKFYKEKGIQ